MVIKQCWEDAWLLKTSLVIWHGVEI
jgi:hypothetical protein